MIKSIVLASVASAALLGAGAASAHGVSWSVGINVPIVAPVYGPAYGAPVYVPAPVYAAPVYAPVPVYVGGGYYPRYRGYYRPVVYPYRGGAWGHGYYRR
jgi:hypothetical protein